MKKELTREEATHVEKLANLQLKSSEAEKFQEQLSEVIDYNISQLSKVNTQGISPLTNVSGLTDVKDEDEPRPSLSQEDSLVNATDTYNGFFKVKAILE